MYSAKLGCPWQNTFSGNSTAAENNKLKGYSLKDKLPVIASRFTLEPQGMHKVELGKYKESDPKPGFQIRYSIKVAHTITRHESKLGDGEVYYLYYNFQSFNDKPCTITIQRLEPDLRLERT